MGTTVWLENSTRAELRRLQQAFGTATVDATIKRILAQPQPTAHSIFTRHRVAIQGILERHRLHQLAAFGSRARGDARPDSDLDLVAKRLPGSGALAILAAEADLEELLGISVRIVELPNPSIERVVAREGIRFGE